MNRPQNGTQMILAYYEFKEINVSVKTCGHSINVCEIK